MTTGVTGGTWRATIGPTGTVEPWSGAPLRWFVAAEDRWHDPAAEASVRQRRVSGTPVTETRVRVPTGDVVQHVYSVADAGGITVVQVTNESSLPVAIAFDRRDVLTERPIADVPIEGIDLPAGSFVLPLAHRAAVRVGLAHDGSAGVRLPRVASAEQVVAGWRTSVERAGRIDLPEIGTDLSERIVATRCDLLLGIAPDPAEDPSGFVVGVGELVRMGDRAEPWIIEVAAAVERIARRPGWPGDVALAATARVLDAADERRAGRDLTRIIDERARSARPLDPPAGPTVVPWLETLLVDEGALFPHGIPERWWGQSLEAHGVPTAPGSSISFAVRWHGARPAVLWEQIGRPIELSAPIAAPGWTSVEPAGEVLWPAPAATPGP